MDLQKEDLISIYRAMLRGRICEERVTQLAMERKIPAHHSGAGHEGVGAGFGFALRPGDAAMPAHRSGITLSFMYGRLSVKDAVLAAFGKGDSRPSSTEPPRLRYLRPVGSLGAQIPVAVGVAMADKLRSKGSVTVCFMGDGGANRGDFHEGVNLAAAHKLPIVFVIENNGFAISTSTREASGIEDLADRAQGYGMPGMVVDGNDVIAVHEVAREAIARARQGRGPSLIECKVFRLMGHSSTDSDSYRTDEYRAEARRRCPIERLEREMVSGVVASEAEAKVVRDEVEREVAAAIDAAWAAPSLQVAATPEFVRSLVYAE